jgi:hypothetical protein
MVEPVAVVTISEQRGGRSLERELRVRTLAELYDACRDAAASKVVLVSLRSPDGEVRLSFASFIRGQARPAS